MSEYGFVIFRFTLTASWAFPSAVFPLSEASAFLGIARSRPDFHWTAVFSPLPVLTPACKNQVSEGQPAPARLRWPRRPGPSHSPGRRDSPCTGLSEPSRAVWAHGLAASLRGSRGSPRLQILLQWTDVSPTPVCSPPGSIASCKAVYLKSPVIQGEQTQAREGLGPQGQIGVAPGLGLSLQGEGRTLLSPGRAPGVGW